MRRYESADRAWAALASEAAWNGTPEESRGLRFREVLSASASFPMERPLVTLRRRGFRFAAAEAAWILRGDDRLAPLLPHAPRMADFSDDGERLWGAYGPRLDAQFGRVVRQILDDPGTRRAAISLWRDPPPGGTRDVPCTLSVQVLLRGGRIRIVDSMRSSDLWLGAPYDWFSFACVGAAIAAEVGAGLGDLAWQAGSAHVYEADRPLVFRALARRPIPYEPLAPYERGPLSAALEAFASAPAASGASGALALLGGMPAEARGKG